MSCFVTIVCPPVVPCESLGPMLKLVQLLPSSALYSAVISVPITAVPTAFEYVKTISPYVGADSAVVAVETRDISA